ncbi:hypothetical protein [Plasmodium yoelii yoelii]|uniref:Uncharacterized protein n=1 Tax=Plasmodium yoelii yoelii TaxID=73239 RepID=Q7RI13_PLAYO|nr:hypothetical protein [Plasmodium yoelii yoelii]
MNSRSNMFQILRHEDKIKKKSKQIKEDQEKKEKGKENEKKEVANFSFDVS